MENDKIFIVFSRDITGHYKNYDEMLLLLLEAEIRKTVFSQLQYIFSGSTILFMDGDKIHLLYLPFIILRNIFGLRSILFSIRSERLLNPALKNSAKRFAYKLFKILRNVKTISIHKPSRSPQLDRYIDDYIYDFQYWDLPFLKIRPKKPIEIKNFQKIPAKPILLIIGNLNAKRYQTELFTEIFTNNELNYSIIFAGKISNKDYCLLSQHRDCFLINRYVNDGELLYLYEFSDIIYCYYELNSTQRPSGIFGRAIQLGKEALVKKGSYLEKYHKNYDGLIAVKTLTEFNIKMSHYKPKAIEPLKFYEEKNLIGVLTNFINI